MFSFCFVFSFLFLFLLVVLLLLILVLLLLLCYMSSFLAFHLVCRHYFPFSTISPAARSAGKISTPTWVVPATTRWSDDANYEQRSKSGTHCAYVSEMVRRRLRLPTSDWLIVTTMSFLKYFHYGCVLSWSTANLVRMLLRFAVLCDGSIFVIRRRHPSAFDSFYFCFHFPNRAYS